VAADQVFFLDASKRRCAGLLEEFPLNGGDKVSCLVIQPEQGGAPIRVAADSDAAKQLHEAYPELDKLSQGDAPEKVA
jgi:hypothetical protein